MVDANIPDIALEPDKTVKKVTGKLSLYCSDPSHDHVMKFSVTCGDLFVTDLKILDPVL